MPLQMPWTPGYFNQVLAPGTTEVLLRLADLMIPEGGGYPTVAEAHVVQYIQDRISAEDHKVLSRIAERFADVATLSEADATARLAEFERDDAADFVLLRWLVYMAYYAAPQVTQALREHGYDYHREPQPLGYRLDADVPVPTQKRGIFIPVEEVFNVRER